MPSVLPIRHGPLWQIQKRAKLESVNGHQIEPAHFQDNLEKKVSAKKQTHDAILAERCNALIASAEEERKKIIGELALAIIEKPQEKILNLKTLVEYANALLFLSLSSQDEQTVAAFKLVIVSILTVFCDIIPSYLIRELSALERKTKVDHLGLLFRFQETLPNSGTMNVHCCCTIKSTLMSLLTGPSCF